jgi:mannose-1-phosphate guanylyltransferase
VYEKSYQCGKTTLINLDLHYLWIFLLPSAIDYVVTEALKKKKVVSLTPGLIWVLLNQSMIIWLALAAVVDENGNMVIGTNNYTAFIGVRDYFCIHLRPI